MLTFADFDAGTRAERNARVRRLTRRVMAILDHDRIWTGPMGEIAAQAAVAHCVESLIADGEQDEFAIMQRVLQTICNGRMTSVLRSRLDDQIPGRQHQVNG